MSKICLTVMENNIYDNLKVVNNHINQIDLVELRVDFLQASDLLKLNEFVLHIPVILTYRKTVDGGLYNGDEEARISILKAGIESGNFSFVDLEENLHAPELEELAGKNNVKIIRSFHDFTGVPKDLANRLLSIKRRESEIPKAAVMINNTKDLLEFYKEALKIVDCDKILLGMGNIGFNTRVLAQKIGSFLTFTSKEGSSAAPGHVSPSLLLNTYNFKNITNDTVITGIIGNPVMHTKSPLIHNTGYRELGLNYVYVPFETDDPKVFLKIAELLDIRGLSVTVPFKTDIMELTSNYTQSVKMIGSCNTLSKINNSWVGENTDYIGFINPLIKKYGPLKGKKVTVIGAGGTTKAALFALKKENAQVLVINRTVTKAKELSELFDVKFAPLDISSKDIIEEYSDIIIQTTNVGMHPLEDVDPLVFYGFKGHEFLYDVIYTPEKTKFLIRGSNCGCSTLNGWQMLLEQGYRQFKLFTGLEYPRD